MTFEEAKTAMAALTEKERNSLARVTAAYRSARKAKPAGRISKELVRQHLESHSMGTVQKYLPVILALEAGPLSESAPLAANENEPAIPSKLQEALTVLPGLVDEACRSATREEAEKSRTIIDCVTKQLMWTTAELRDEANDAYQAGLEAEALRERTDQLEAELQAKKSDRAVLDGQLDQAKCDIALLTAHLEGRDAENETHRKAQEHFVAEVDRLNKERDALVRAAERGREAQSEIARLRAANEDAANRETSLKESLADLRRHVKALEALLESERELRRKAS
jgi:chromosome segregation ATPase